MTGPGPFFRTQSRPRFPPGSRRALTLAEGCGQTGMVLRIRERPLFTGPLTAGWQLPLIQGSYSGGRGIPEGAGEDRKPSLGEGGGWHLHGISSRKDVAEARASPEMGEVPKLPEVWEGMSLPGFSLRLTPNGWAVGAEVEVRLPRQGHLPHPSGGSGVPGTPPRKARFAWVTESVTSRLPFQHSFPARGRSPIPHLGVSVSGSKGYLGAHLTLPPLPTSQTGTSPA